MARDPGSAPLRQTQRGETGRRVRRGAAPSCGNRGPGDYLAIDFEGAISCDHRPPEAAMKCWVGTSGFSYKEWKGSFYPEDLSNDGMLTITDNA